MVENLNTIIDTRDETASNVFSIAHERYLEVERKEEEKWMLHYIGIAIGRFGGDTTLSEVISILKHK